MDIMMESATITLGLNDQLLVSSSSTKKSAAYRVTFVGPAGIDMRREQMPKGKTDAQRFPETITINVRKNASFQKLNS